VDIATTLMQALGEAETNDFNRFKGDVDQHLKQKKIRLSVTEKNAILNAVSWYDETAEKVIKKRLKLSDDKLDELLHHLGCKQADLADFGYYPLRQAQGDARRSADGGGLSLSKAV
jgi:type I restriction enzyme M protein